MFPPEIADQRKKSCQQVALSGQPVIVHDNREGMDLEAYLWPVTNQNGKVDRIALFARDITERILAEKKVIESHELLHNLARQVPGVIYQYRLYPDGRSSFPYASPGMFNIYEVTPEEVKEDATPAFGRLHIEDLERVTEDILRSAKTLTAFHCEFRVVLPQQGLRWRWSQAQPQKLEDGSVLWHGIISDITKRKEFEEALKTSEEDLKESQKIAHIGSWRLDVSTNKVVWSDELYRMCGFDPTKPPPPYSEHQKLFTQESWERLSAALQNTVDTGTPYTLELETVRKDEPNGWMWVYGMAVLDKNGKTIGLRGVSQDISERKTAEKERDNLNTQLVQAQKMESVGRLAGGVAHDYNNMLGVIIGYSELALEKIHPNEPLYSDLNQILNAANRSAEVTRQLLAFSRQQTISPKRLSLNATIEGMLKMLRRLIGEDIDLIWKPKANIHPIEMDPSQLDQILVNLCVNARDAILDVGTITIETGMKTFDTAYCGNHSDYLPGDYVALIVSDNGCGMTKDIQRNLFEPFFTTKEMGKGTGLGLAIVYGIVKQNNGFINVYSEPDQGSSFKLYFPCEDEAVSLMPNSAAPIPDAQGNETILLVEDEESILNMTAVMLGRLGYQVIPTQKPDQAIETARLYSTEIHLLMTDVIMPKMNGRQLSKTIQLCYPDIKVLFMSGYTAHVIAHHGVLNEGINFIQKPFTKNELSKKLREVLDG